MINGTNAQGVGYHGMPPIPFVGMHHHDHQSAEAANSAHNSHSSGLGMGLELDDDDTEDEEKKGYDQAFELARPNASEAIHNFVVPDGENKTCRMFLCSTLMIACNFKDSVMF